MINYSCRLKPKEVFLSSGNFEDETQLLISRSLITKAIQQAFPALECFTTAEYKPLLQMPIIQALPPRRTVHATLGPIKHNEGTINGQYEVLNEFFCNQFKLHTHPARTNSSAMDIDDGVDWTNRLYLVYGDQKTAQLIRSVQSERTESIGSYDSYRWILAIPALFHLQMNLLWTIQSNFEGKQLCTDDSSLYHAKNILGRKHIPSERAPFHLVEELVEHSFNARIIGLLYVYLRRRGVLPNNLQQTNTSAEQTRLRYADAVQGYLQNLTVQQVTELVEEIRDNHFGLRLNSREEGDEEFENHIHFLQVAETYLVLKYAIKHADIGLLRRVIARCCYIFIGSGASNYANELLRLHWLTSTDACTPALQDAILGNGLVNLRGKPDTWYPVDRLNEHLNLSLKELLWARRNSTFTVDHLFDTCTWSATYCQLIQGQVERTFGEHSDPKHTIRSRAEDLQTLGYNLARRSLIYQQGRKSVFSPKNLVAKGESDLVSWVDKFNGRNEPSAIPSTLTSAELEDVGADGLVIDAEECMY